VTRSVRLRPWQKRALDQLAGSARPDFLAVATPGAGKTTFALTAVRQRLALDPRPRVVVVAPTAHLKRQWAEAAARFDLHLEHQWSPLDGALPADVRGVVTTYQQVASAAPALAAIARDGLVVFDELHHAGDDRAWGDGVRAAFAGASWRLALSGTPFRSDTRAIPFVDYVLDEARPDYEYGYGEALADANVVRPVEFPRLNGHMEWVSPDGTVRSAAFDDALDQTLAAQRLRTALSLEGEWLPAVLDAAHAKLLAVRAEQPDAGGLVIATDREHARGISRLLRERHGVHAVVATSEDAEASDRIARFAHSTAPWIVAVRMVSEGVDIPRLRVGVFATTTTTELFFRQAVGRLVRWTRNEAHQHAYLFIPDDARLRARAQQVADQRRHSLRRDERSLPEPDPTAFDVVAEEQLSLFAALSAVPVGDLSPTAPGGGNVAGIVTDGSSEPDDPELLFELAPLPARAGPGTDGTTDGAAEGGAAAPPRHGRKRLRELNAARASDVIRHTGLSHARVHAELNRQAGITRITEATEAQLERRLAAADRWIRQR